MNQLKMAVVYVLCVATAGIIGFASIEHLPWLDAIYLTITTISTVGYGDVVPVTAAGKIFVILFIIFGVGTAGYTLTLILSIIIEGHIKDQFGRHAMLQKIAKLNQHVIVCGAGRVGQQVIAGLKTNGKPFVVIESDPKKVKSLLADEVMAICGDAKLDKVLQTAGVKKAAILVAALSDDADNVYVTLSAKSQNANLIVVARADEGEAESKLKQAGATTIISPSISGGRQILAAITHPLAYDFLQNMFYNQELFIDMAEISIEEQSELVGKTPQQSWENKDLNLLLVAINQNNHFFSTEIKKEKILTGDIMLVLGQPDSIHKLAVLANTTAIVNHKNTYKPNCTTPY
ncbi:MAG: potassium channel protein [Smithella sp.]